MRYSVLSDIALQLFKCFKELVLPVRPLTLLTGTNASGKSTVIQALTLLHQTAVDTTWGPDLILDGSFVSLGTIGDVVDKVHGRGRTFSLGLESEQYACVWRFESDDDDKRSIAVPLAMFTFRDELGKVSLTKGTNAPRIDLIPAETRAKSGGAALAHLIETMSYISAERTGPRETYPLGGPVRHRTVGIQGELAPGMLHWHGTDAVHPSLQLDETTTLYKQTQAWLAHFFPGAGFEVQPVRGANLVTLGLRTSPDTDFHRPQNVGFGLSHILPIIVAALHAKPGDLVIVENPEVHLHPQGQARMGQFLARVAAAGVQVFIESHSDHVLNGVRRSVRDGVIPNDDVIVHFFQPRQQAEGGEGSQVVTPIIDRNGNIDHWPEGFFDQFEKDLGYLAGL